jgi:hypothetical protein
VHYWHPLSLLASFIPVFDRTAFHPDKHANFVEPTGYPGNVKPFCITKSLAESSSENYFKPV